MWDLFKDLPGLLWRYVRSREGKKCLRRCYMPILVMGSMIMLVVGAIWAKYQYPTCGTDYYSSRLAIYTQTPEIRFISGNMCPGYDWTRQKAKNTAGEHHYDITAATKPRISMTPFYVTEGLIGFALNSVPIYASGESNSSDAVKVQSSKFDSCGGSDSNPVGFTFDLPVTGVYRYFAMPGDGNPNSHSNSMNLQYNLCPASQLWYKETDSYSHSPLVGILADGIPIYGPKAGGGALPTDLDECGGHASDLPFYHYHFKSVWPYSVRCLRGCLDGQFDESLDSNGCNVDLKATAANNYTSLLSLNYTYGGSGENSTDWTGPTCLLVFGFFIFIPGMLCCICMLCGKRVGKWHLKQKQLEKEDEDEVEDDSSEENDEDYEWVTDDEDDEEQQLTQAMKK